MGIMIKEQKKIKDKSKERDSALLRKKHEIALSNWSLLNEYDPNEFNCKHKKRVSGCYSYFQMLKIQNMLTNEEVSKNLAFNKCDLKYCPLCQFDLAKKWFNKLLPIVELSKNQYFITLTWPNIFLADLVDKNKRVKNILYFNCDNDFKKCNKAFHWLKNKNDFTKSLFKNCVRKSEDTICYFDKSYNFHYHCLCSLPNKIKDIEKTKNELSKQWTQTFKKFFPYVEINSANGLLRVDIQKVKDKEINNELTAYVAKDCIKSFKKEDILQDFKLRLKSCKKEDLKEYLVNSIQAIENLTQEEITELNAKWLSYSKGMRVFNISGFKDLKKEQLDDYWENYKFDSFQEYRNFNLISQCKSELDFLYLQCIKLFSYNSKREILLSKQEVVDLVFSRAKFKISIDKQAIINMNW